MSIPVELARLAETLTRFRFAYLMTSSADAGAPHVVAVTPAFDGTTLTIDGLGRRTRANAEARPAVGLVWPPLTAAEYSLIVDGEARLDGDTLRIRPTRAVLHRPATPDTPAPSDPSDSSASCGADCVEILPRTP